MRRSITIFLTGFLMFGAGLEAGAQDQYVATPVTISKEKVKDKDTGKVYYSHPVLAKQTLFSICKAYGVTLEEVYEANPSLHLDTEPLQQYQILRIPDKSAEAVKPAAAESKSPAPKTGAVAPQEMQGEYLIHTVKWFEDLAAIAKKYGISQEAVMKFNGLSSPNISKKQKLKIPTGETRVLLEASLNSDSTPQEPVEEKQKSIVESVSEALTETAESIFGAGRKDVDFSLILPFNAAKSPSENNLEFYSGVLLAMRDLESEGIKSELSVYDCANGSMPVTEERFRNSDFVIGPISVSDMTNALNTCPEGTVIISPLDPKAADLAKTTANYIHAPSPADAQCLDLVNWLKAELRSSDKVVLLTEKNVTPTANASALIKHLAASGIDYSTINYGILEGKNISASIEKYASANGNTRVVIASESEAFVNDAVRNVNLLAYKGLPVTLYCLSRVRNFETIEVENFHATNLHLSMSYFVDYDSPKVQHFLMEYRALFNAEPGQFALQGYDIAYHFIKQCATGGRNWVNKVDNGSGKGLQANFRFTHYDEGGYINNAVRRVVYGNDYSIKLINQL